MRDDMKAVVTNPIEDVLEGGSKSTGSFFWWMWEKMGKQIKKPSKIC